MPDVDDGGGPESGTQRPKYDEIRCLRQWTSRTLYSNARRADRPHRAPPQQSTPQAVRTRASPAPLRVAIIDAVISCVLQGRPKGAAHWQRPQPASLSCARRIYAGTGIFPTIALKISPTRTPAAVTPATATSAINATSSAYSSKSCPSSSRQNAPTICATCFMSLLLVCVPPQWPAMPGIPQPPYHAENFHHAIAPKCFYSVRLSGAWNRKTHAHRGSMRHTLGSTKLVCECP